MELIHLQKLPYSSHCFVCGDSNSRGLGLRFEIDGDRVQTTFTPGEPQMGYRGITHGGILATLLDETMGWPPVLQSGRFCVTLELTVQYLKPVPIGREVTVVGWVTADRRRAWETAGEVKDADGEIYAKATGLFVRMSEEDSRTTLDYLVFDEGCIPPDHILRASAAP
jgi:uncharacterized protein (TIGR00369 family)